MVTDKADGLNHLENQIFHFQSESTFYTLPVFPGTPCSKQAQYLKFK